MKLSTKSLLSALVAATVNSTSNAHHLTSQRHERRYEKILQKHDRKGELRASVLGVNAVDFRQQERKYTMSQIVNLYGFKDERAFYRAVVGKIRQELRGRGWTSDRIHYFEVARLQRIA